MINSQRWKVRFFQEKELLQLQRYSSVSKKRQNEAIMDNMVLNEDEEIDDMF